MATRVFFNSPIRSEHQTQVEKSLRELVQCYHVGRSCIDAMGGTITRNWLG